MNPTVNPALNPAQRRSATAGRGSRKVRRAGALLAAAGILATGSAQAQAETASGAVTRQPAPAAAGASQAGAFQAAAVKGTALAKPAAGPDAAGLCPTNLGRIACVDLTHQRMWVQVGSKVVFGPVQVRTGRRGYVTRTGLWHIYWRDQNHYSSIYHVAMPYSQFFSGGEAFHGLNEPMSTPPGSHGCVNMNTWDARTLWGILKLHDPVKIFGRKPGT
ncbi:hypothetical protein ABIA33_000363 [Streptacidiphilus sp. MAP12-16]|uniref:L,D-transpeptidase n=1 Tax=Streptacidiphilus sp. MAP12-16 TaxID=3156300 RepID=UPI0035176B27